MPGPVFRGRCIVEIKVPQKTVCQNDCERCGRTWFSPENTTTAKVIVRMVDANRESPTIDCSYDVLCEGCTNTVQNLLKSLSRDMKKLGPRKARAKKEGAIALPEPVKDSPLTAPDVSLERTLAAAVPRQPHSGPSKRQ